MGQGLLQILLFAPAAPAASHTSVWRMLACSRHMLSQLLTA